MILSGIPGKGNFLPGPVSNSEMIARTELAANSISAFHQRMSVSAIKLTDICENLGGNRRSRLFNSRMECKNTECVECEGFAESWLAPLRLW